MFPWRKRNQGFEWREYVRTEILVRRRARRQKLDDAKEAAVLGVKQAGRAGASAAASGASAAAQGTASFFVWLGPVLGRILSAAGTALRTGAARTGAVLSAALRKVGAGGWAAVSAAAGGVSAMLSRGAKASAPALSRAGSRAAYTFEPLLAFLGQPAIRLPLTLIAGVTAFSAVFGIWTNGLDGGALTAGAISLAALAVLAIPRLVQDARLRSRLDVSPLLERAGDALALIPGFDRLSPRFAAAAAFALVVMLTAGGAWLLSSSGTTATTRAEATRERAAPDLEGRAVAVTGDTLRFAETTVALDGIEAPERDQECLRGDKRWRCGEAAKDALARMIRGKRVSCELTGTRDAETKTGRCNVRGADLAQALVREGFVFAEESLFATYGTEESDARRAGSGLWSGESDRPADYRAKRWEEARRAAPEGCPIKGRVASGSRIYVLPWSAAYDSVRVVSAKGERWFCSEAEAQAAGWRPVSPSS